MPERRKAIHFNVFYLIMAILGIALIRDFWGNYQDRVTYRKRQCHTRNIRAMLHQTWQVYG